MSKYDEVKDDLVAIVKSHYDSGAKICDIRAAIRAADLMVEQFAALELMEFASEMRSGSSNEAVK